MSTNMRGRKVRKNRVEFLLNDDELEALEQAAHNLDCPVSHVLRLALWEFREERTADVPISRKNRKKK